MSKVIEMPKSNAQMWSDLFNSFLSDIDKIAEHHKAQHPALLADLAQMPDTTAPRAGTGIEQSATNRESVGLGNPQSAKSAGIQSHQQSQEMVNLDDLGIGFGDYEPDPRDEEPWSDTQTRIEQMNSIKGR